MPTDEEHLEIKNRAAERLLRVPGITAVGLGSKEVGGRPTGELAIKVFVKVKRPPEAVPAEELIPPEIEGVPTDVIESGEIHKVADPTGWVNDGQKMEKVRRRPVDGGCTIRRKKSEYCGTLGCLLWDPADHSKAFALTCFHVVQPPDVPVPQADLTPLGQPTGKDSATKCCSDIIGNFAGGTMDDDRDEALVRLASGIQWLAEIRDIGAIAGKHTVTQAEATPQTYKVRKRGARSRLTGGVIRALSATTHSADNELIIQPNPNPAAGTRTVFFAFEGDSGSALVNEANEIVGLIDARDDSGNGYAWPIQHVLDRFASIEHIAVDVAIAPPHIIMTVPGSAMAATPPELAAALGARRPVPPAPPPGWIPEAIGLEEAPPELERDLDRSAAGRLLITVWLEHQAELLTLVNTNRRVTVAWHRSGAAALFQMLARMTLDRDIALPETINGLPIAACLDRMQAALERAGSAPLVRDIALVRRVLPDLAGLTYPRIIDALGTAPAT